jgi:plasmid stability protein
MPALHLRNVPEDIIAALKERAARNHRSAEAEHRRILEEALRPRYSKERMEALAAGPLDDPVFDPEGLRSKDTGRKVEL